MTAKEALVTLLDPKPLPNPLTGLLDEETD